jgi:hypothetical protein
MRTVHARSIVSATESTRSAQRAEDGELSCIESHAEPCMDGFV